MASRGLRILYFGTPELAVPTFDTLLASRHEVVMVVSQPDRPRGRGRRLAPSPVSEAALAAGVPLLRPERVGDAEVLDALAKAEPDVGVVVAFGQFMPRKVRELPRLGYCINAHASLLPRHRGAAPVAQAILDGDEKTGISIMRVEREMDAGPVALVRETPIREDENAAELAGRLSRLAAEAVLEALDAIEAGSVTWVEQDASAASVAPKLGKADGRLDWTRPARELVRRIHGLAPKPGAFTTLPARGHGTEGTENGEPEPLRILRARAHPAAPETGCAPGTVRRGRDADAPPLLVATGDGWLEPLEVQRAGGRAMETAAFLRGHDLADGIRLGAPGANPGTAREGAGHA